MDSNKIVKKAFLVVERLREAGDDLLESIKQEAESYGEAEAIIERTGVVVAWRNKAEAEYLSTYMKERLREEERGLPLKK